MEEKRKGCVYVCMYVCLGDCVVVWQHRKDDRLIFICLD